MPTKMIWLLPMWSNAGSRMFPRFFSHLTISLSQARGQRTAERLKVSSTFSKVAGCGTASHGLGVARGASLACRLGRRWTVPTGHQRPAFPYSQKGGTNVPLLGWHRARGFCLRMGRAGCLPARRGVAAFARIRYNGEKPGRSPAMILSGKEIQRHMGKDIVIQPFDPKRLARGRAGQVANAA